MAVFSLDIPTSVCFKSCRYRGGLGKGRALTHHELLVVKKPELIVDVVHSITQRLTRAVAKKCVKLYDIPPTLQ